MAVRHTHEVVGDVPLLVTENGFATSDDQRRIAYTGEALRHLRDAMDDGIDVRGYLRWSLLDNFEWDGRGQSHWLDTPVQSGPSGVSGPDQRFSNSAGEGVSLEVAMAPLRSLCAAQVRLWQRGRAAGGPS
ncbi:family 1 glycosylhydrolase [Nonomuraea sp. 10N515B]|uniref:family 1 glycosylhydrolase n=1 Tax=Nonomuraea sp. 10N515B TaxID=3457422 RepID=UPI003FCEBED4